MIDDMLEECFFRDNEDFSKMMSIITTAKNRVFTQEESVGTQVHHIVPRSYFKKKQLPIDNNDYNLVTLSKQEHALVHFYAWKCAKPIIKRSMSYTVHLMLGIFTKDIDEEMMLAIVSSYKNQDLRLPAEHFSNEKFTCLERFGSNKFLWKCNKCGLEIKGGHIKSCPNCIKEKYIMDEYFVRNTWYLIQNGILSWDIFEKYSGFSRPQLKRQAKIYEIEMRRATTNNQKEYILLNDTLFGTYSSIAKKLGVTRTTIKEWENEGKLDIQHINSDECMGFLIQCYENDPSVLDRIKEVLDRMLEINSPPPFEKQNN